MTPVFQVFIKRAQITKGNLQWFGWWLIDNIKSPYNVVTGLGESLNMSISLHPMESIFSVWSFTDYHEAKLFEDTWGGEDAR